MNAEDLERLIDRELKQLPGPKAPATLLPRVLVATVHRRPAPWYARPWVTWPRIWQVASVACLVALGIGVSMGVSALPEVAGAVPTKVAGGLSGRIAEGLRAVDQGATVVRVFWQVLVEPIAFYLLVLAISLTLACAAVWAALERVALGGASRQ